MIVYLHGFASSGTSPKVDALVERFGGEAVVSPNLPFDPREVENLVGSLVAKFIETRNPTEKLIFVGTSLGAFYATYFGHKYDCPVVVVNPSSNPSESLRAKLGPNVNYSTGEEFFVSMIHLEELAEMRKFVREQYSGALIHLFVAKDDDVIPYQAGLEAFPYTASLTITEDGGHRFTEHWGQVVDQIEKITKM